MRVKVGETVTVGADVDLIYECSACGEKNMNVARVTATADTSTLFGFNLKPNYQQDAVKKLEDKILAMVERKDAAAVAAAGVTCRCRKCYHQEPWAKTDFTKLKKFAVIVFSFGLALALCLLIAGIGILQQGSANVDYTVVAVFVALMVVFFGCSGGIFLYIKNQIEKYTAQALALPEKSIPLVLPHDGERFRSFMAEEKKRTEPKKKVLPVKPESAPPVKPESAPPVKPESAPTGGWVCSCGRAHPAYESSCACGKSKLDAKKEALAKKKAEEQQ